MARREVSQQQITNLVAAIYKVYPQAVLDPDSIGEIMPIVREELAAGKSVAQAVKTLCSCDGQKVFPSQAAKMRIRVSGKLAVSKVTDRPPNRDELEDPPSVKSLRQRLSRLIQRDVELSGGIALMSLDPEKSSVVKAAQKRLALIQKRRDEVKDRLIGLLRDRPWAAAIDDSPGANGTQAAKARRGRPKKAADASDVTPASGAVSKRRRKAPPVQVENEEEAPTNANAGDDDDSSDVVLLNRLSRAAVKDTSKRTVGK